jgi:hypothetical protein
MCYCGVVDGKIGRQNSPVARESCEGCEINSDTDTKGYQQLATDSGMPSLYLLVLRDILPRPMPREALVPEAHMGAKHGARGRGTRLVAGIRLHAILLI